MERDGDREDTPDCEYKSCTWLMKTYENNICLFTDPVSYRILTQWKTDSVVTILYRIDFHSEKNPLYRKITHPHIL